MSSELLGAAQNVLKGNLGGAWDINKGYADAYTDLGIARRFGGSSAAYSLRDIGAMNGPVVNVRREPEDTTAAIDDEAEFSANQVQSGALEDWVNGKLESTLPADVATSAAAYSLRKVKASYSGDAVRIRRSSDDIEVDVAFDSDNKVSASSAITNIAEQGGEIGSTTATTLGDFISGTDAFVHTWYDQAGVNNAVQETAANQPKIAESGALLDGIKFSSASDGTSANHLDIAAKLMDSTDGFMSSVINSVQDMNQLGVIYGNRNNNSGFVFGIHQAEYPQVFYRQSSGANRLENSNFILSSSRKYLLSVDKDGTNDANLFGNAVSKDTDSSMNYRTSTGSASKIGQGGNTVTSDANGLNANINELIFYNSDQAANRFKIESNINNYYGLYNDANDLAGNFTVDSSGSGTDASISNESKTGFTATVVDKAGFFGADLNEAVPNGSNLYISFNANLSPSGGTAATPNFGLANSADKTGNSTGNPLDTAITEGFNSITVAGTASTCDRIRFTEGNDNVSFIISDFKVSRIARDGFVETWYDQSGNGFDLKSQSADTQPFIVNNGGFTGGVYSPSRTSNSTKQYLEVSSPDFDSTDITSSKFGWLSVMANMEENVDGGAGVIFGNTRGVSSFGAGSIALNLSDTNEGRVFVTNTYTTSAADFIGSVDDTDLFDSETIGTAVVDGSSLSTFLNGNTGSGTFSNLTLTSTGNFRIFQSNDGIGGLRYQTAAQGFIKELMFMQGDTIDDIVTIRNEVNNHYNIF
jgi:hypothetical protein